MASAMAPQTTAPNSTKTSRCRFTDSVGLAPEYPSGSERIGGDKAGWEAFKRNTNVSAFLSETEFYDDLAAIDVRVLVMNGEDDRICPFPTTGARSVKLLKHGALKSYPSLPQGMPTRHADQIKADLLAFIRS